MSARAGGLAARLASVAILSLLAGGAATVPGAPTAHAATSTAVVVIDTGTSVRHAVIRFDGTVNGIEALKLAGGNPTTYGYSGQGAAVCSIDGVGNPADQSCLVGPNGEYWAYYRSTAGSGTWSYSRGCACTATVRDGDVEGWRYGLGAAPRASASFCFYVGCPPPPPPTSTSGEGALPAAPGPAPTDPAPSGPPAPAGAGEAVPPPEAVGIPDSAAPTSTTLSLPTTAGGQREKAEARVARAPGRVGGGGGGRGGGSRGSPAGVAVAAGVLAASVAAGVVVRRRRRAPG